MSYLNNNTGLRDTARQDLFIEGIVHTILEPDGIERYSGLRELALQLF